MQPLLQVGLHKKQLSQKNKTEFWWGINYCRRCRWRQERDKKSRQTKRSFRSRFINCDTRNPIKSALNECMTSKGAEKMSGNIHSHFGVNTKFEKVKTLSLAPSFRFEDFNTLKDTWLGVKGLVTLVFRFNPKTVCLPLATHDKFSAGRQLFPKP